MTDSTCAVHSCTTPTLDGGLWCAEHRRPAKLTQVACPECGRPKSEKAKTCMICRSAMRFYGTYHPELPKCKMCGRTITGPQRSVAVYCSRKCKFADPEMRAKMGPPKNQVAKTCRGCAKQFSVPASNAHRYNYCTLECSLAHRGEYVPCKRCGKVFRRTFGSGRKHCSEACRRPVHLVTCQECGNTFRVSPSDARTRRFCNKSCYRRHTGETSIEAKVREHLDGLGVIYFQEHQIGAWVVDFLVLPNLVIEANGDYWHSLRPEVDLRKTRELEAMGYMVYRFTETEINGDGFARQIGSVVA